MILALRTDKPVSEIYFLDEGNKLAEDTWEAHRQLADTLLKKIEELLQRIDKRMTDITKIGVYEGPGSFTGLRIGISVANALSYSLHVPVVQATGEDWLEICQKSEGNFSPASPKYGREPHITDPKK